MRYELKLNKQMITCLNHMIIHDIINLIHKLHGSMRALEHASSSKCSVTFIMKHEYFDFIVMNVSNRLINTLKQE